MSDCGIALFSGSVGVCLSVAYCSSGKMSAGSATGSSSEEVTAGDAADSIDYPDPLEINPFYHTFKEVMK